jgi:hypothetical protein
MDRQSHLRASDAERERTGEQLREHFTAGRLSQAELDERLQGAYRASTVGELAALMTDLPALPLSPAQQKAALAARRAELRRRLLQQTGGSLAPFVICTITWAASGHGHPGFFWPVFVLVAVLAPLLRGGWALYGPAPDLDRVEREIERARHHGGGRPRQRRIERRTR